MCMWGWRESGCHNMPIIISYSWSFLLNVYSHLCKTVSKCERRLKANEATLAQGHSKKNVHPHLKGIKTHQLSFTQSRQLSPRILTRGDHQSQGKKKGRVIEKETSVRLLKKCSERKSPWQRQETTCFHHGNKAWV